MGGGGVVGVEGARRAFGVGPELLVGVVEVGDAIAEFEELGEKGVSGEFFKGCGEACGGYGAGVSGHFRG